MRKPTLNSILVILLVSFLCRANMVAQSKWEYSAALYGWLAGINGEIGIANQEGQFEASLSDLLQNLKFTAGGHFEARNPKFSFIADVFFVGLGNETAVEHTVMNNTVTTTGEVNLDEWIVEGAVGYRVTNEIEMLIAGRYYSINTELLIDDELKGSVGQSWEDIYIGARYLTQFGGDWFATARADVGLGGSTFAWFGTLGVGYEFSDLFSLALTYRILYLDYDTGSGVEYFRYAASMHGLGIGAVFNF